MGFKPEGRADHCHHPRVAATGAFEAFEEFDARIRTATGGERDLERLCFVSFWKWTFPSKSSMSLWCSFFRFPNFSGLLGMFIAMVKCLVKEEVPARGMLRVIEMADLSDASVLQLGLEIRSPRQDCSEIMIQDSQAQGFPFFTLSPLVYRCPFVRCGFPPSILSSFDASPERSRLGCTMCIEAFLSSARRAGRIAWN